MNYYVNYFLNDPDNRHDDILINYYITRDFLLNEESRKALEHFDNEYKREY